MLYMIKLHVLTEDRSMAFDKVLFVESQMTKQAIVHILKWTKGITSFKVIVYSDKYDTYIPGEIISDKELFESPIRFEKTILKKEKVFEAEVVRWAFPQFHEDVEIEFNPCRSSDYTYIKIHNNSIFEIKYELLRDKLFQLCGVYLRKCTNNGDYWCSGRYFIDNNTLYKQIIREEVKEIVKEYYFTIRDNMYNY